MLLEGTPFPEAVEVMFRIGNFSETLLLEVNYMIIFSSLLLFFIFQSAEHLLFYYLFTTATVIQVTIQASSGHGLSGVFGLVTT